MKRSKSLSGLVTCWGYLLFIAGGVCVLEGIFLLDMLHNLHVCSMCIVCPSHVQKFLDPFKNKKKKNPKQNRHIDQIRQNTRSVLSIET